MQITKPKFKAALQATVLIGIGSLQMAGDLLGNQTLKGLGAITHASPAPKVFTTQNGFETYSPTFTISALDGIQQQASVVLTPAINAKVRGPYNRRNAYGAAISYGPVLASNPATKDMFAAAFHYGFCNPRGVARDIELPVTSHYRVHIASRANANMNSSNAPWPNEFAVNCNTGLVTSLNTNQELQHDS